MDKPSLKFDVVILGGALAGASLALLVRRHLPHLRVLVIERESAFDWKVGESTVEVSGYFLSRVLRLHDYLAREQLPKHSFRYWYHNGQTTGVRDATEVGPFQQARIPSFQLDRARLDEHVLGQAAREGAELWRPAKVVHVSLAEETGESENLVRVEREGATIEVRAGWVADASGRAALLARRRGWLKPIETHPTTALWARYRGVKDLDGPEIGGYDPDDDYVRSSVAPRRLATNHFMGYGYWMWFIPLKGGETSVGAVWDKRLVEPPGRTARERLDWFLQGNPISRELMEHAEMVPGDLRQYAHLPYLVDRAAGKWWSAVGDAVGFLDPFYSPGLDSLSYTVTMTLELLRKREMVQGPAEFEAAVRYHGERYPQFLRWFYESIFRDKYYLMGDYDTMTSAFLVDTSMYYFLMVMPLYWWSWRRLLEPPYYHAFSKYVFPFIRGWERRLVKIARRKWKLGIYGARNHGRRYAFPGFEIGFRTVRMLFRGLCLWLRCEAENAWTYIARPRPMKAAAPGPVSPPRPREAAATPEDVTLPALSKR